MNLNTLGVAIDEAQRFLDRAKPLYAAMKRDEKSGDYHDREATPKMSGAAKRASLDLTRALAEMRRPA